MRPRRLTGADALKSMIHVTLPVSRPTITIMLILRMGGIMSIGVQKTLLLYNSTIYETADIISTFTYRKGFAGQRLQLQHGGWSL